MSTHCVGTALVVELKAWEVPIPSFVHYISESSEGCIDPLLSPPDKLLRRRSFDLPQTQFHKAELLFQLEKNIAKTQKKSAGT